MGKKFKKKFVKKGRQSNQKAKQHNKLKRKYRIKKRAELLQNLKKKQEMPVIPEKTISTSRDLNYLYEDTDVKWLIVELNEDVGLEEHHERIEGRLKEVLGSCVEYFIPIYSEQVNEKSVCVVLFEGYVFVKSFEDAENLSKTLHDERIKGPLIQNGSCQYVECSKINGFKIKLNKMVKNMIPQKGQMVVPRVGVFKNLEGKVLSVDKRKLIAKVIFKRASRIVEAPINIINLQVLPG